MKAALLLALAALPPARASAATCHTYTPAERADATLMCAAAVDYEFSMPAGFHPDEAARALVGGDDAADGATWATAKETVWAGIAAAATTGCPLWIAEGTYLGLLMALRIHAAAQTKGDEAAA